VHTIKVIEVSTLDGILGCAAAGRGIAMSRLALLKTAQGRRKLRVHRLPPSESHVETVFIRRRDRFLSPALTAFLKFVRETNPPARKFAQPGAAAWKRTAAS
jgi:LysR family transcriptional regulator, cell division regulator